MKNRFREGECPTYINLFPDASFGASHRAWQGCPSVAVTQGGRVFAAWYTGGLYEPCIFNYNVLALSEDGGSTWIDPVLTVGTDTDQRIRNIDLQLFVTRENHLWLMWTRSPYYKTSVPASIKTPVIDYHKEFFDTVVMECRDPDGKELVWESPRVLCGGFMRNKPVCLSTGRMIAPAYDYASERYVLRYSEDGGKSFSDVSTVKKPDTHVFDETMVWETQEGISMMARTRRGYYLRADSGDFGETWGEPYAFEAATGARFYMGRLKNGMVAYVRNLSDESRTGMKLSLSEDGGRTFPYTLVLDTRDQVSYPDLDEDGDGNLYIVYDRERDNRRGLDRETWHSTAAKEILISRVRVEDVIRGTVGSTSYLSCTICRGGVNTVEY